MVTLTSSECGLTWFASRISAFVELVEVGVVRATVEKLFTVVCVIDFEEDSDVFDFDFVDFEEEDDEIVVLFFP